MDPRLEQYESLKAYLEAMDAHDGDLLLVLTFKTGDEVSATLGKYHALLEGSAGRLSYSHWVFGPKTDDVEKIVRLWKVGTVDVERVLAAAYHHPTQESPYAEIRVKGWLNPAFKDHPAGQVAPRLILK